MGEAPTNPTGFAHGFRPLEGDHPPPTPTQRDQLSSHSQGFTLSAMSQQTPVEAHRGAVGMGSGSAKKRRRLPGPLAFLQQGGSGGVGQQDGGGDSDKEAGQQRSGDDSNPDEGEASSGHFWKGPWLSLCSATDAPIADECASDTEAVQAFLRGAVSPMSEVLAGDFDLRVPIVTAVIDSYTKLSISDVVVDLVDPSGRIKGYLHPGCLEEHGPFLGPGAALLLKEVSIFVSGPGTTRLLNVHPDCILAVFPADTPLPDPQRLEWLTTCDPPFTPRTISDSGDEYRTQREPSSRTPSPTRPPPTGPTSSLARPGSAWSRVRPRPYPSSEQDSDRGPPKQKSQRHYQQQEATPKSDFSTQRSVGSSQGQRNRQQQQRQRRQHGQEEMRRREQADRRKPSPPRSRSAGRASETQGGTNRATSSPIESLHGERPLPPSPPSPPSWFSPSQLQSQFQLQSQSQSQTQQQIALGQHSDDDREGPIAVKLAASGPAADRSALLSGASSGSIERDGARDVPVWEKEDRCDRDVSRDSTRTHDRRSQARGKVDDSVSARSKRGAHDGGAEQFPADTCDDDINGEQGCDGGGGGDSVVDDESGGEERVGEKSTLASPKAATGARFILQHRQGNTAGPRKIRRGDLASSDLPRREDAKRHPLAATGEKRETVDSEVGEARSNAIRRDDADECVRRKTAGVTPSIWADLEGLGSSDDSSSGGEEIGGGASPSPPLPEGLTATDGPEEAPGQPSPQRVQHGQEEGQQQQQSKNDGDTVADGGGSSGLQSARDGITTADNTNNDAWRTENSGDNHEVAAASGHEASPATPAGDGFAATGSAGFSLLEDAVGNDELLDAALDDSD